MIIRRFQLQDQREARWCILEGLGEHFGFIDESCNPDLDNIADTYAPPHASFFVAEDEMGRVVGTGCLLRESEGRVVRMSVLSSHRRQGVGRDILGKIIEEAKHRGMRSLVIATEPHWEDAVGFYRSTGFVPYGNDEVDIYMRLSLV